MPHIRVIISAARGARLRVSPESRGRISALPPVAEDAVSTVGRNVTEELRESDICQEASSALHSEVTGKIRDRIRMARGGEKKKAGAQERAGPQLK